MSSPLRSSSRSVCAIFIGLQRMALCSSRRQEKTNLYGPNLQSAFYCQYTRALIPLSFSIFPLHSVDTHNRRYCHRYCSSFARLRISSQGEFQPLMNQRENFFLCIQTRDRRLLRLLPCFLFYLPNAQCNYTIKSLKFNLFRICVRAIASIIGFHAVRDEEFMCKKNQRK